MGAKVNERVGAICSLHEGKLELYGYGVYVGDIIPETEDVMFFGRPLKSLGIKNPCIKLDNGETVWGCECWWDNEERVKGIEATAKEVIIVNPSDHRKPPTE